MPYITQERRQEIIATSGDEFVQEPGDFNYVISSLINNYIKNKGKSYTVINEIIGALECAKLELYRRVAAPYEDIKIEQNGDVYWV